MRLVLALSVGLSLIAGISGQGSAYGDEGCADDQVSFELVTGKLLTKSNWKI